MNPKHHRLRLRGALVLATACAAGLPLRAQTPPAPAGTETRNGYAEVLKPTRRTTAKSALIQNQPYAPISKQDDDGQIPEIEMFVGESRVFPAPGVSRIAVGNGSLLTAAALDNKEVILFANGAGTSSLFIWNADGRYQRVKISIVPGDTARYAREIAAFLSTIPKARASVVGANIIVEGDELSDADILKIEELAKRYPQIVNFTNRVGWEQMVMMDVKVMEFPVTELRELGLKWSATGGAAIAGIWGLGRRGHSGPYEVKIRTGEENTPPITGPNNTSAVIPSGLNAISFLNMGLNAQLNLLAQEGKAVVLAEPHLSARNGAKASFLAGGEIPYAFSNRDGVFVQFKTYGVKLDITPKVDRRGVVRATIHAEVSGVDRSITTAGGPALLSRKTETEFNLREGETIVLAGLVQREQSNDVDKVPLLGDIPVLGALFRSKRFQNKETELVVFVTPTVVNAQSPDNVDRVQRAQERLEQRLGPAPHLSEPLQPGTGGQRPKRAVQAPAPVSVAPQAPPAPVPAAAAAPAARGEYANALTVVAERSALRATPSTRGAALMQLERGATVLPGPRDAPGGAWRNVMVGALSGWLPAEALQPLRGDAAAAGVLVDGLADRQGKPVRVPVAESVPRAVTASAGASAGPEAVRYLVGLNGLALRATPDINAGVVSNLRMGEMVVALPQPVRGGWTPVQAGEGDAARRGWVSTQWLRPLAP